jgi:hypothetical protein
VAHGEQPLDGGTYALLAVLREIDYLVMAVEVDPKSM